jgi:hypothetical protein
MGDSGKTKRAPESDELLTCRALFNRREFGKLSFGFVGAAVSGLALPMASGKTTLEGDPVAAQVIPYGLGPYWPAEFGDVRVRPLFHAL